MRKIQFFYKVFFFFLYSSNIIGFEPTILYIIMKSTSYSYDIYMIEVNRKFHYTYVKQIYVVVGIHYEQ